MQFKNMDHFHTYAGELNPSVFSNAHAIHALAHFGLRQPSTEQFLVSRQGADGRWLADKWHSSWRYTTLETVVPLAPFGHGPHIQKALHALLADQNDDGGWGARGVSNALETAYGVMMLHSLRHGDLWHEQAEARWRQAAAWLLACAGRQIATPRLWIGKELYSPRRVDHAYVLCAQVLAAKDLSGDQAHRSTPRAIVLHRSASHLRGATHLRQT